MKSLTVNHLALALACLLPLTTNAVSTLPDKAAWQELINRQGSPKLILDIDKDKNQEMNPLFDLGSWHGLLLPSEPSDYAAFTGPLILVQEYPVFLSNKLDQLTITNLDSGQAIALESAKTTLRSLPGVLYQRYELPELTLTLELRFVTNKTALVKTTVENTTDTEANWKLTWQGDILKQWSPTESFAKHFPHWDSKIVIDSYQLRYEFVNTAPEDEQVITVTPNYEIHRSIPTQTSVEALAYTAESQPIKVAPHSSYTLFSAYSYTQSAQEKQDEQAKIGDALANGEQALQKSQARWEGYLQTGLNNVKADNDKQRIAIKSIETLIGNWRSPSGEIKHDSIAQTSTNFQFNGIQASSGWKEAVALSYIEPELAKNTIRSIFDFQVTDKSTVRPQDSGMIVDTIYYQLTSPNDAEMPDYHDRNTNPPLASWAVWKIYTRTQDKKWLGEMYPLLERYHKWWYRNRDHNQNGLVEYGATLHPLHNNSKGEIRFTAQSALKSLLKQCHYVKPEQFNCQGLALYNKILASGQYRGLDVPIQHAAIREAGMVNPARFGFIPESLLLHYSQTHYQSDNIKGKKDWQVTFLPNRVKEEEGKNTLVGYSINQESVELNAYLYQEKSILADIADKLGDTVHAQHHRDAAEKLKQQINQCFFDSKTGYYYDRQISEHDKPDANGCTGTLLVKRGKGAEGWAPVWTHVADKEKADAVIKNLLDDKQFNTFVPFPTLALTNPAFDPKEELLSAVFLDQVFFATQGMKAYGYQKEADELIDKIWKNAQGLSEKGTIKESYHPVTGEMQGASNFSRSAATTYLLYQITGR